MTLCCDDVSNCAPPLTQRVSRRTRAKKTDNVLKIPRMSHLPTHFGSTLASRAFTALMFNKNSNTDTHDNDTYDIKLILHTIFFEQWRELNVLMPHQHRSIYKVPD